MRKRQVRCVGCRERIDVPALDRDNSAKWECPLCAATNEVMYA